jgi:hypothetical protein
MNTFTIALWADLSLAVEAGDMPEVLVDGRAIPQDMAQHIFAFGFRQILRDAGAISAADAAKPTADEDRNSLALKKLDRVFEGTLREGSGGGKRLNDLDKAIRQIVDRELAVWAKGKGRALPTKASELEPLRGKWLVKHGERIEAQARDELARLAAMADLDIDL